MLLELVTMASSFMPAPLGHERTSTSKVPFSSLGFRVLHGVRGSASCALHVLLKRGCHLSRLLHFELETFVGTTGQAPLGQEADA
jgi:hypothetical protein